MNPYLRLLNDNRGQRAQRAFRIAADEIGQEEAHVYLYEVIVDSEMEAEWFGGVSAVAFAAALRNTQAPKIRLHINSPGGSVFAARAMATALRDHSAHIVAQIDGLAASAASVLAMSADEIIMGDPGAMMMIHKAWTYAGGNADDLLQTAAVLEKIDGTIAASYATRTGLSAEAVLEMMTAETWMTADEAVALGFANAIATAEPSASARTAAASWNLGAFANAPRLSAASPVADNPSDPDGPSARLRQSQRTRVAELAYPV